MASLDYLKKAIGWAREHDFVLAIDECYGDIYDTTPPPGSAEACRDMGGEAASRKLWQQAALRVLPGA